MSIATAITDLQGRISAAYGSVAAMGGTVPSAKNSYNLPSAIESIPTASDPTYGADGLGFLGQLSNGTLVAPDAPQTLRVNGLNSIPNTNLQYGLYRNLGIESVDFPDLTDTANSALSYFGQYSNVTSFAADRLAYLPQYAVRYAFRYGKIKTVSMSRLTDVAAYGGTYFCGDCPYLESINLPVLQTIGTYGFSNAFTGSSSNTNKVLTSVAFPALTTVGAYAFQQAFLYCARITSISFPNLTTAGDYAFRAAIPMGSSSAPADDISFPKLTEIPIGCFAYGYNSGVMHVAAKYVRNVYFPEVQSIVGATTYSQTECTLGGFQPSRGELHFHFPKCAEIINGYLWYGSGQVTYHFAEANRAAIEATAGFPTKWGTANATIAFDL